MTRRPRSPRLPLAGDASPLLRPAGLLIATWVLAMIGLPILRWTAGDAAIPPGVLVAVLLQAGAVLALLWRAWGPGRCLRLALLVGILAWGIEALGSTTGFPFGAYHYTKSLQPQLLGVPLIIPLAWLMMLPPAWAVARLITGRYRAPAFILASAVAFTVWDLFLDPQMAAWGFWVWEHPSGYFGIPWLNFLGWLLASALLTALARPTDLPLRPLLLVYAITWALESVGLVVFWGLPGPGLVGFVAMGGMVGLALWRLARQNKLHRWDLRFPIDDPHR